MSKFVSSVFVRSPYNYDMDAVSRETALTCLDESLAVQSEKDETDINTIVRRFGLTGELPGDFQMPQSGDFTKVPDFQTAMNLVIEARNQFLSVPADVRARFGNDPQAFMNFLEDDQNRPEAERMGLLKPRVPEPAPALVRIVPDAPKGA